MIVFYMWKLSVLNILPFFFNLSVHIFLEETTVHKTNFNSEWDHFKEL